jgi:hypothetical protein
MSKNQQAGRSARRLRRFLQDLRRRVGEGPATQHDIRFLGVLGK